MKRGLVYYRRLNNRFETTSNVKDVQAFVKRINNVNALKALNPSDDFIFSICLHDYIDIENTATSVSTVYDYGLDYGRGYYPTIHFTYNKTKVVNIFSSEENVRRSKKIMDSSIWNYYFTCEDNCLVYILTRIVDNFDKGLYELDITREYADLNLRLLKQSYLIGGHVNISPFLFHSEHEMDNNIEGLVYDEKKSIKLKDEIKKYRWRFLLLDDKGIECLKCDGGTKDGKTNKLQIIANNLNNILGFDSNKIWFRTFNFQRDPSDNDIKSIEEVFSGLVCKGNFKMAKDTPKKINDVQIVIDCVSRMDEAEYCLKYYRYEIVMLDYLLDKVNDKQEWGYQLLQKLHECEWNEIRQKNIKQYKNGNYGYYVPGPNKRFYFMFTSAFTTAVHERLLAEGFAKSERGLWYIGDGACPTNTPYLFAYQLLLLMRHRITDLMKDNEGGYLSIIDLLEHIYVEKGKVGTEETRQKAHEHFNHVLFMRDKYKRLENDFSKADEDYLKQYNDDAKHIMRDMRSSLLVQSAFKVVHHFSGAFFEHLQHLVYLTAFGTIRQWQDMWEEYVFVNKELCDYDKYVDEEDEINWKSRRNRRYWRNQKDEEGKNKKRGKAISDAIREYIINLKENNY